MKLIALQKRFKPYANNFDKQMQILFKKNTDVILGLNRNQLVSESVDIEGDSFPNYAPMSVTMRKAKGLQTARMDFVFSGKLQKQMFIKWNSDGFIITSSVDYANEVQSKWLALGLTDENLENLVRNIIIPSMLKNIFK